MPPVSRLNREPKTRVYARVAPRDPEARSCDDTHAFHYSGEKCAIEVVDSEGWSGGAALFDSVFPPRAKHRHVFREVCTSSVPLHSPPHTYLPCRGARRMQPSRPAPRVHLRPVGRALKRGPMCGGRLSFRSSRRSFAAGTAAHRPSARAGQTPQQHARRLAAARQLPSAEPPRPPLPVRAGTPTWSSSATRQDGSTPPPPPSPTTTVPPRPRQRPQRRGAAAGGPR